MLHMVLFLENLEPLQPPPWNFGTAEWNHEQLKQLSRPPQGPLQIGLSCLSQLHAGALVPIDLFSHLFYLQKARHRLILQNQPLNGDTFPILVGPTLLRIHHHGS